MNVFDPYAVPPFIGPTGGKTEATADRNPMPMLAYIGAIQRQLIDVYHFPEYPTRPGLPQNVPDGEYPMRINGRLDHVRIRGGKISCCNFEEGR